ncbi:transposase [Streptomyces sp. NRRL F-4474]|uniref:transposase n=1 Tax=Streptomyces sp. NRRL F-4474 TaxID=1463851 RepID=UPI003B63D324
MLEALLPKGTKPGRPPIWTRRQLIDGIRFRVRTGIPWRDVPAEYGPWGRVYDLFRRWQRDGTWQWIFVALQARADAKDLITWNLNVDSTVCRAHQHAAGARKRGSTEGAARRCRQRAGRPWARTLARRPDYQAAPRRRAGPEAHVDRDHGRAARRFPAVRGRSGTHPGRAAGPGRPRVRPRRVRADKAYASRKNRSYLRRRGIRCTIPDKADRSATARSAAHTAADRRSSSRRPTRSATQSSAASTASRGIGRWPRNTTSSRSAMRRPSSLRPSTSGCDRRGNRFA